MIRSQPITRAAFIEVVESYIGTPVAHRGRVPHVGLDCVGLIIAACRELGMVIPEPSPYGRLPDADTLRAGLRPYCTEMPGTMRVPGDILQVYAGRQPRHVVVYTGQNECGQHIVVHAWGKNSRVQRALLGQIVAATWSINAMGAR